LQRSALAPDQSAHNAVEEVIDFLLFVAAPAGRAELAVPDPVDQLADGQRNVRARPRYSQQLGELADQAIDVPRGVPGAPFRGERKCNGADIRRRRRISPAQCGRDPVEEGVDVFDAVAGRASPQRVLRGLQQVDRARISLHRSIISLSPPGCLGPRSGRSATRDALVCSRDVGSRREVRRVAISAKTFLLT
jgi:hypothetical protein